MDNLRKDVSRTSGTIHGQTVITTNRCHSICGSNGRLSSTLW